MRCILVIYIHRNNNIVVCGEKSRSGEKVSIQCMNKPMIENFGQRCWNLQIFVLANIAPLLFLLFFSFYQSFFVCGWSH